MPAPRLLLVSRDDILGAVDGGEGDALFRRLATLTRRGLHLLATAPQPEKWTGDHGNPDDALLGPESISKRLADAGGKLDGVYYVRHSLLTQRRNRLDALNDILKRYGAAPESCTLISSNRRFVEAGTELGIHGIILGKERPLGQALSELAEELARASEE